MRPLLRLSILPGFFAVLYAASSAQAQQPGMQPPPLAAYRGRIVGVFDLTTGLPIEGAQVIDLTSGAKALTTSTGTVSLVYLPDGGSLVRIRKIGYTAQTQFIAISPSDTAPLTLLLASTMTILPAVVTKDSAPFHTSFLLREFEQRRKIGMGHYITADELRKNDDRDLVDVLRLIPGVAIQCTTRTAWKCVAVTTRPAMGCSGYTLYVDGARLTDTNLKMLAVSQFGAVEQYPSGATAPAEYNSTGNACGVLLFWSREKV